MTNKELNQPVTRKYLGEYTEEVLLPAMGRLLDEKLEDFATKDDLKDFAAKDDLDAKVASLVTKDYLDDKLADQTADLTVLMRKEDRKLGALIELLKSKKLISQDDADQILSLEPFPKS